jgi:hypothetical protein
MSQSKPFGSCSCGNKTSFLTLGGEMKYATVITPQGVDIESEAGIVDLPGM